jgi:hypothetical protein
MNTKTSVLVGVIVLVAVAVVALAYLPRDREERNGDRNPRGAAPGVAEAKAELDQTQRALEEERAKRRALEVEVDKLRNETPAEPVVAKPAKPDEECADPECNETPPEPGPPTDEEIKQGIQAYGQNLHAFIVGEPEGLRAADKLREILRRATDEQIAKLGEMFLDETADLGRRVMVAHAMGQSARPAALDVLKTQMLDPDSGMLLQRFASHALAFSPAEGLEGALLQAARDSTDSGVRANSAFGLIRRDVPEGPALYAEATDAAFENGDPEAMQYLGGFALMGSKGLPYLRERLTTYEKPQARLLIIALLKDRGDRESLSLLHKLAYDASQPTAIQKAAKGAIEVLQRTETDSGQ